MATLKPLNGDYGPTIGYVCDECYKKVYISAGIDGWFELNLRFMPGEGRLLFKHFCSMSCFWAWEEKCEDTGQLCAWD